MDAYSSMQRVYFDTYYPSDDIDDDEKIELEAIKKNTLLKHPRHKYDQTSNVSIHYRSIRMLRSLYTQEVRKMPTPNKYMDFLKKFLAEPLEFIQLIPRHLSGFGEVTAHNMNPPKPVESISVTPLSPRPILLIHGDDANPGSWKPLAKRLNEESLGPVFTVHRPTDIDRSTEIILEKIREIADRYDCSTCNISFDLIGQSGGANAIIFTLHNFLKRHDMSHINIASCSFMYDVDKDDSMYSEKLELKHLFLSDFTHRQKEPPLFIDFHGRYDVLEGDFAARMLFCNLAPWNPDNLCITVDCGHMGLLTNDIVQNILVKKLHDLRATPLSAN